MALSSNSHILCTGGELLVSEVGPPQKAMCCRPGLQAVSLGPTSWRSLRGPVIEIATRNGRSLALTPDHPILMRLTATSHWVDLVLGHEVELGYSLAVRTARHRARWADCPHAFRLVAREEDEAHRRFWILGSWEREESARLEKACLACRYGLPDAEALPGKGLALVLKRVPTERRGEKLLHLTGHDASQAHGNLRLLTEGKLSRHMVAELLLYAGKGGHRLTVTPAAAETRGGARFSSNDPRETQEFHDEVEALCAWSAAHQARCVEGHIRLRLGRSLSYLLCPAANLVPGARIPVIEDEERVGEDVVDTVRLRSDEERVWDPRPDGAHTLVANGIVVGLQYAPEGKRP